MEVIKRIFFLYALYNVGLQNPFCDAGLQNPPQHLVKSNGWVTALNKNNNHKAGN
jgi:hypothetical protein